MNFLIKIFLPDTNPYNISMLLDDLNTNIVDKDFTKIHLMLNDPNFEFDICDFTYLNCDNTVTMINHNLDQLDWDIVLPIFRNCIATTNGFDSHIKDIYLENFPNLDGCLWLDSNCKDINMFPIIGRKYYEKFNYIYNPIYTKRNFEKEFSEVLKLTNQYFFVEEKYFREIKIELDDDNIYQLRKKVNFELWK
jgi:hypothetical protein